MMILLKNPSGRRSGRSPTLQNARKTACFLHWRDDLRVVHRVFQRKLVMTLDPRDLASRVNAIGRKSPHSPAIVRACRTRRQGTSATRRFPGRESSIDLGSKGIVSWTLVIAKPGRNQQEH